MASICASAICALLIIAQVGNAISKFVRTNSLQKVHHTNRFAILRFQP